MSASTTTRSRRLTRTIVAIVISMAAIARGASAQPATQQTTTNLVSPGNWTVTPFIGFAFSGDLDSGTGAIGVAGGYIWNSRVSLEGEFNLLPSSEYGGIVEVDSTTWSLTGNVLYHFAGRAVVPYAAVGIGFGHGSVDIETNDPLLNSLDTSSTEFVVNFGGGIERSIRERLALRGDLRYFIGGDFVPDFWRASVGITFDLGSF